MRLLLLIIAAIILTNLCWSQQQTGRFSGRLETNANFFMRDSAINTVNSPQYDHQLFGSEGWLNLNYSNWGFDLGLRFDFYQNSNLLNPNFSDNYQGIGNWFIKKTVENLEITGGYIYDQVGSGIIFRAWEERALAIDNALLGLRLAYNITPDWRVKVFTGKQRYLKISGTQKRELDHYGPLIKGGVVEGFVVGKEGSGFSLAPGAGIVSRTIDDETMETIVNTISTYTPEDSTGVKYNTYAFSLFNTLTAGKFTWYVEAAYKTEDVYNDPFEEAVDWVGNRSDGQLVSRSGSVLYTSMSYATKGFGATLEGKRTRNFTYRVDPFVDGNNGRINFLPPMQRVNTYRLNARYNAATQEIGEWALQADVTYSPNRKWSFNANFSNINTLDDVQLYQEVYTEILYKYKRKWQILGGLQHQNYNQEIFEGKKGVPPVKTITPYVEFLYKFNRKTALRLEAQYMNVGEDDNDIRQDYGDWLFGLAEFTIAPHWTFTISDMYNAGPGKNSPLDPDAPSGSGTKKKIHYPRFDIYYTHKSNRFSLSYIKQVEGVVCSGGICRLEPAFSGVRLTVNSSF